jgi:Legionella pneumophila major outer membrane protein precursor
MKTFGFLSLGLLSTLFADVGQPAPDARPYDYDLFSKDRECEYVDVEALVFKLLNNQAVGSIASSPSQQTPSQTYSQTSEKIQNMKWLWRPGFRVTVGYFNAPKYWEVMGQYTWFEDRGHKTVKSPNPSEDYLRTGCYLPIDVYGDPSTSKLTKIQATADLYYNDLSTLVTRNFYPNPHLRLRVIGGLTSMWAHQTTNLVNTFTGLADLNNKFHSKYWGVGFKMGTSADWYWGKDFYITGKVFWAIVTGRWNTNTKVTDSSGQLYTQVSDSSYNATQNFQFIFGPSYQKSYEKMRWELFVGYEFNTWLGALTTYNYSLNVPQGWVFPQKFFEDLTLTGVNVRLTLDF